MAMNHVTSNLLDATETSTGRLSCATDALSLLREIMDHNLRVHEELAGGMGYYLRISNAMAPVIYELERINADLTDVVAATYEEYSGRKENIK